MTSWNDPSVDRRNLQNQFILLTNKDEAACQSADTAGRLEHPGYAWMPHSHTVCDEGRHRSTARCYPCLLSASRAAARCFPKRGTKAIGRPLSKARGEQPENLPFPFDLPLLNAEPQPR
jgi:hypothetical protein